MVKTLENTVALQWKLTGVGISKNMPQIVDRESDDDSQGRQKRKTRPKKPFNAGAKLQSRKSKACDAYNAKKNGCTKNPKKCPVEKLHICKNCGLYGHGAWECKKMMGMKNMPPGREWP